MRNLISYTLSLAAPPERKREIRREKERNGGRKKEKIKGEGDKEREKERKGAIESRAVDSFWDAMWLELWRLRFMEKSRRIVF